MGVDANLLKSIEDELIATKSRQSIRNGMVTGTENVKVFRSVVPTTTDAKLAPLESNYDIVLLVFEADKDIQEQVGHFEKLSLTYYPSAKYRAIFYHESNHTKDFKIADKTMQSYLHRIYRQDIPYHVINIAASDKSLFFWEIRKNIIAVEKELQLMFLIEAFKRIYTALREGQTDWLKTNFLDAFVPGMSHEAAKELIERHVRNSDSDSRTAKAWYLAQRYVGTDIANNLELFKEIYAYAFEHSGWFFRQSKSSGITFFDISNLETNLPNLKFNSKDPDSRTAKIKLALKMS